MAHFIPLFSDPGDIFANYPLNDRKVTDVIERLLASIDDEEPESEHRNHSHSSSLFPFIGQLNAITSTVIHPISSNNSPSGHFEFSFPTDAPFMTTGTHTTPSWFFEEEEAADMPSSADTVDGGYR
ncbi:hypothetical protein K443DRAFT_237381 [Laccaria amethystina LaAM-08-1]|uniref:Uncharacterized protein n=1 Tax=Laccaria amethystina LaAM-08-1 TaxID=1095629 RepID=A0A0C9XJH1_9AGAR|nr:hypothetical protein K443DRAFT_237381 [Laccaria amethystina LaAM-08-1]